MKTQKPFINPVYAIDAVIMLVMVNNILHMASLYHLSFHGIKINSLVQFFESWDAGQSLAVSVVVDLSLFLLIMYGQTVSDSRNATFFAIILFVVNALFGGVVQDWFYTNFALANANYWTSMFGKLLFSGLFAYILHLFTHLRLRHKNQQAQESSIQHQLSTLQHTASTIETQHQQLVAQMEQMDSTSQQNATLLQHLQAIDQQNQELTELIETQWQKDKTEADQNELKRVMLTLYQAQHQPELCDSIKQMAGKMRTWTAEMKAYHKQKQAAKIEEIKNRAN